MELLFHQQISSAFEPFVDEIDLAVIALSCHFALDVRCYRKVFTILHDPSLNSIARGVYLSWCGTTATVVHSAGGVSSCPVANHWGFLCRALV